MKKVTLFLAIILVSLQAFSQVPPDTLTPEKYARWKTSQIINNTTRQVTAAMLRAAYTANTNFVTGKVSFVTMDELRSGKADTAKAIRITDKGREGNFLYDPSNTTSLDDSAMVLRYGNRRYIREDLGYIRPEWFGAKRDSLTDDYIPIQKMFNWVSKTKYSEIHFTAGTYVITQPIKPKPKILHPKYNYDLNIVGQGDWSTIILCKAVSEVSSVMEFTYGSISFIGRNTGISISKMRFNGNGKATKTLSFKYIAGLTISEIVLSGGVHDQLSIDSPTDNYGISLRNIYSSGSGKGNSHSVNNFYFRKVRYALFDRLTTDGSKYGMMLDSCDKNFITNCHIEGSKTVAIYVRGGENKVTNNFILPYGGFEADALFRGDVHSIKVESPGGSALNIISNNFLATYKSDDIPLTITGYNSHLHASPHLSGLVTSNTGATGYLYGFNPLNGDAVLHQVSGTFAPGQTITQYNPSTAGTGIGLLGAFIPTKAVGMGFYGAAGVNRVVANQIRGTNNYSVWNESDHNEFTTNSFAAHGTGFYNEQRTAILHGNFFYVPGGDGTGVGVAIHNNAGIVKAFNPDIVLGTTIGDITREFQSTSTDGYIPKTTTGGGVNNSVIRQNTGGFIGIGGVPEDNKPVKIKSVWGQMLTLEKDSPFSLYQSFKRSDKEYHLGINVFNNGTKEFSLYDKTAEQFRFVSLDNGNVKIGGNLTDNGYKLEVDGTARATKFYVSALNTAPASATATGTTGEIRITATYIYVCTATDTWVRTELATW